MKTVIHSMPVLPTALLVLLCSASLTETSAQGLRWSDSVDAALEQAKAENKVVLLAFNIDGEKASDAMVKEHYRDAAIQQLGAKVIHVFCSNDTHSASGTCSRCGSGDCARHRNNDFNARKKFFGVDGGTRIIAPQHVFVSPDGKVIASAAGWITVGELEWLYVHAIRTVDPQFAWAETGRFRAPVAFKKADVDKTPTTLAPPPTRKEVAEAVKEAKKADNAGGGFGGGRGRGGGRGGFGGFGQNDKWLDIVLRSDASPALAYVKSKLKSSERSRSRTIRKIGTLSPDGYAKVVADWLDPDSDRVRRAAVIALEQLRSDKALSSLRNAQRREKVEDIQGRMLRAMASLAPTNSGVIGTVKKTVQSDKSEILRAHATVASGILEDRAAVTECLRKALQDAAMTVRATAAYVIAIRQDKQLLDHLNAAIKVEADAETRQWMERAVAAVQDSDPKPFADFLRRTLDQAEAAGFGGGRGGPGRGGAGGGGPGGTGEGGAGGTGEGGTGRGGAGGGTGGGRGSGRGGRRGR